MNAVHWLTRFCGGSLLTAVTLVAVLAASLAVTPHAAAADVDVYFARQIWTAAGEPIDNAAMVVQDGKITAIGSRISMTFPREARFHDFGGKVIIPGLVVAQTGLSDQNNDVERALTPQISALDGFSFYADRSAAFTGGVTTVQLSTGESRLVTGVGAVVKLLPADKSARVLNNHESLRVILSQASRNPPTIYEPPVGPVSEDRPLLPTRPQLSQSLAGAASGLRALFEVARNQESDVQVSADDVMNALVSHLAAEGAVRITANTPTEIRLAVQIANEAELNTVLVDPADLRSFEGSFDDWSGRVRGVILAGKSPGGFDNVDADDAAEEIAPWQSARELLDAGMTIAIRPADDDDLQSMLFVAGQFQQDGLSPLEALSAVTRWPAEMMGVDESVGTLAAGKDADFVVLTDAPFALHSNVSATYVDGEVAYERKPAETTTVIKAGAVYTGDGRVLMDTTVVVKGHTVRGMGAEVSAPLDANVLEYPDAVIVPGFVDMGANVGAGGVGNNVSLQTNLGEQVDATDPAIAVARQTGVTTVLLGAGGNNPSPVVAYKLGHNARVLGDPVAIRFPLAGNLATTVPRVRGALEEGKEYHETWLRYEAALAAYEAHLLLQPAAEENTADADDDSAEEDADAGGQPPAGRGGRGRGRGGRGGRAGERSNGELLAAQVTQRGGRRGQDNGQDEEANQDEEAQDEEQADESDSTPAQIAPPEKPEVDAALEPYRALFSGKIPAFVEARQSNEIESALQLFREEFQIKTVLIGVDDIARLPSLLEGQDVLVCAGPDMLIDMEGQQYNIPQMLANDRIPFGFQSQSSTGVRDLPHVVQFAVNQGLGAADALRALTSGPADMLAEDASFGRLAVGKDADLVLLSGPPFELSTKVLAVMIDGQWVYQQEDGQ